MQSTNSRETVKDSKRGHGNSMNRMRVAENGSNGFLILPTAFCLAKLARKFASIQRFQVDAVTCSRNAYNEKVGRILELATVRRKANVPESVFQTLSGTQL